MNRFEIYAKLPCIASANIQCSHTHNVYNISPRIYFWPPKITTTKTKKEEHLMFT